MKLFVIQVMLYGELYDSFSTQAKSYDDALDIATKQYGKGDRDKKFNIFELQGKPIYR